MLQVTDTVTFDGKPRRTKDGYMVVNAKVARTGIQVYSGDELGRSDLSSVRVLRPETEVFSDAAMASFAHRPVTVDHPRRMVTAENWKDHAVGMIGDKVARDGEFIQVAFTLMDQAAITAVEDGKRELSCGYLCELDWTSGSTDAGEQYDAIQREIRGNHLAVVDRGRAGSSCRIGDAWTSTSLHNGKDTPAMADNLRAVMVDGLTVHTTDQGAQAIEKLQRSLADATASVAAKDAELGTLKADHTRTLSSKDGVLDTLKASHAAALSAKDGEIDALKSKMPDAAALDAMLVQRAATIDTARKMLGDSFDPKGKSDADIRRVAVIKAMGDAAKDRDDSYISAAFDALAIKAPIQTRRDPVRDALRGAAPQTETNDARGVAHGDMLKRLSNGWQNAFQKENA